MSLLLSLALFRYHWHQRVFDLWVQIGLDVGVGEPKQAKHNLFAKGLLGVCVGSEIYQ